METLLASPCEVSGLLVTAALREDSRGLALLAAAEGQGVTVQEVSESELASAADTETPQGVLAIAVIPPRRLSPPEGAVRYLVLDALQDPGNVGTVIRTAAAMGVTATVALPGTVDVWNAKVVRGSMGALFHHPVVMMPWEAFADFANAAAVDLWAADVAGDALPSVDPASCPDRLGIVVSNEGAGLSPHVAAAVTRTVRIPMAPEVESLNVAVATGIMLYALRVASPAPQSS